MIQLPEGSVQLTADQAAEAILTGDHPESLMGGVAMDCDLIDLIRLGLVIAVRLADGRLAFVSLVG